MDECHGQHYSENISAMFFKWKRSVSERKKTSEFRFSSLPPSVSPPAAQALQRWWAPPGWGAKPHKACISGWGLPLFPEGMAPSMARVGSPHTRGCLRSTGSPLSCWSPLQGDKTRRLSASKGARPLMPARATRETQETRNEKHWSYWNIWIAFILPCQPLHLVIMYILERSS